MAAPALVLGVDGQDGSYLAEHLLDRGRAVVGVGRREAPRYVEQGRSGFTYVSMDLTDLDGLDRLLEEHRPESLCHFAAVHGPAGFAYEPRWKELHAVNVAVTHGLLEHLRTRAPGGHLLFPSSAKVFGAVLPSRVSEATPRQSTCLYSLTKNTSHELIEHYRDLHGVRATVVHLFNHESPRRPGGFLIPMLVDAAARGLSGGGEKTELRTLDFHANWGDAREYMALCADLLDRRVGEDLIMAHDTTWYGADFAEALFARHGLEYRDHLDVLDFGKRSSGFRVDTARLEAALGKRPVRDILEVCDEILRARHPGILDAPAPGDPTP
jgi:GDPmannose 4,6-dehydratase